MRNLLAFTFVLLLNYSAHAVPFAIDANAIYFSDSLTQPGSEEKFTRMATDASIGLSLVQDESLFIAVSLFTGNSKEATTTTTTWKSTDYGIRLMYFIDRVKQWGLGVAYHLSATGERESGGTKEYWKGTSYKIDFGYTPLLFHRVYFGLRINYYLAQYDQSSTDNINFSAETNKKQFIYPSIYLGMRF